MFLTTRSTILHLKSTRHISGTEGLVDDNNLYEWEVMIIGYVSPLTV